MAINDFSIEKSLDDDFCKSRKKEIATAINALWPLIDAEPDWYTNQYPQEFDFAIGQLKKCKKKFIKRRGKRGPKRPKEWDKDRYLDLFIVVAGAHYNGLKDKAMRQAIGEFFGISDDKKIYDKLKKLKEFYPEAKEFLPRKCKKL